MLVLTHSATSRSQLVRRRNMGRVADGLHPKNLRAGAGAGAGRCGVCAVASSVVVEERASSSLPFLHGHLLGI